MRNQHENSSQRKVPANDCAPATLTFVRQEVLNLIFGIQSGRPLRLVNCDVLGVFLTCDLEEAIEGPWANRLLYKRAYAEGLDPDKDKGWRNKVRDLPGRREAHIPRELVLASLKAQGPDSDLHLLVSDKGTFLPETALKASSKNLESLSP